jgi:hypothetical protein
MVMNASLVWARPLKESEKTTTEYQLPKSVMKWVALGLVLSSAVVIIISICSGVTLSDLTKLGYNRGDEQSSSGVGLDLRRNGLQEPTLLSTLRDRSVIILEGSPTLSNAKGMGMNGSQGGPDW